MPLKTEFGVATALALIQKLMDVVLQNIHGVFRYLDVLVSQRDEASHSEEVFKHLKKHGFGPKQEK